MQKYPIHSTKRIFDIVFSFLILTVFSPLILLILISIFIEHAIRLRPLDPFFYGEIRFSQGNPFTLFKFNIFKHDVVLDMRSRGTFIHTKDLERNGSLLYVGWVLKQVYLDELPQFFNILTGDMSVVGPRPVNEEVYSALMSRGITDKAKVRAGLTGYYQCHKHTADKRSDDMDKEYVDYYANNPWYRLMLFDFKILLRTVKVLILAKGI